QIIAQVVERFVRLRSSGRRISIDEALGEFRDLSDRDNVRAQALQFIRLSQNGRIRPSSNAGATEKTVDVAESLPELDGYDVIDTLGRGGMGAVFEAYQQS